MGTVIAWTALILGACLILAQIYVSATSVRKKPTGEELKGLDAGGVVAKTLESISEHVPLATAGIVLILIAAVASGEFAASIVFGDPAPPAGE